MTKARDPIFDLIEECKTLNQAVDKAATDEEMTAANGTAYDAFCALLEATPATTEGAAAQAAYASWYVKECLGGGDEAGAEALQRIAAALTRMAAAA